MRRPNETLHYGLGEVATLAARCRTSGNYATAGGLECAYGERRTWDANGQTMFATFPSPWFSDQDRTCRDAPSNEAPWFAPLSWDRYAHPQPNRGGEV